jgi:hypothetical protein
MYTLSFPTLGLLFELAENLFDRHTELPALMMRCDLMQSDRGGEIRWVLLNNLMAARAAAEAGDQQAHRKLLRFARLIVEKRANHPRRISPHQMGELREELLADGYELTWEPASLLPDEDMARCKIRPTDAAPVPLAAEISALDAELTARGYTSVLNHYRQAVDGFAAHKYESANGDLRTTLEDLVTRLAEDRTGYQRQRRASQGGAAIAHMVQSGHLPGDDGGALLQGLWKLIHTNGPHPGHSDADEARFRMQVITATARFLLNRFRSGA